MVSLEKRAKGEQLKRNWPCRYECAGVWPGPSCLKRSCGTSDTGRGRAFRQCAIADGSWDFPDGKRPWNIPRTKWRESKLNQTDHFQNNCKTPTEHWLGFSPEWTLMWMSNLYRALNGLWRRGQPAQKQAKSSALLWSTWTRSMWRTSSAWPANSAALQSTQRHCQRCWTSSSSSSSATVAGGNWNWDADGPVQNGEDSLLDDDQLLSVGDHVLLDINIQSFGE